MKRCLKITAMLVFTMITTGCASESGYRNSLLGDNGSIVVKDIPLEQLNPSALRDYSWYSFYAKDQLTAARETCPGKTWCDNQQTREAITLARKVVGRAYGPPVGKDNGGVYQLAQYLKQAELSLYNRTTVKDVHRYE